MEEIIDTVIVENENNELQTSSDVLDAILEPIHQEIPNNSNSLLVDEATSRFSGAIWYEAIQQSKITLAGLGGIGSYVAFLLARMSPRALYLYDPDTVETVNMSGQFFGRQDRGTTKVSAIGNMINNYTNFGAYSLFDMNYIASSHTTDIMICGFDNMVARKTFFEAWKRHINSDGKNPADCLFIDGRLAAEEFQILCIAGNDEYNINKYETEFLFTDEEADPTLCSYKQTTFMANMIASFMVNLFVNFIANSCEPLIDRDLPFYTEYNAETMFFKTIA